MAIRIQKKRNTFSFNDIGEESHNSSPYEVIFPVGKYFLELYGASGGGNNGGKGGYTTGIITIHSPQTFYFYIGGKGRTVKNNVNGNTCINGGWNGGGEACSANYQSSGGGGTDIRLSKNDNYDDRIIVAGGGGGDGDGLSLIKVPIPLYKGGDGGGEEGERAIGFSGHLNILYGNLYSNGGNQTNGGISTINSTNTYHNTNGGKGIGGKCAGADFYCGSGGGGYYGGGGGFDVTGGGGGSGYINTSYITNGFLYKSDHIGNGEIIVTFIRSFHSCIPTKRNIYTIIYVLFIFQLRPINNH